MSNQTLPLAALAESPFNYRLTFNPVKLQELAESIKAVGVLQPLVVRPLAQTDVEHTHEVVAGHRRLRAAKLADLDEVPVVIKVMTDEQARLVQLHENIQREDPNPIEEAMGLQALKEEFKISVPQLMKDTGKSRSYIYNRLRLATLTGRARDLCLTGKLDAEVATLISALPEAMHDAGLKAVEEYGSTKDEPKFCTYKAAQARIQNLTEPLEDADFDLGNPAHYPTAGACTGCEFNSSNDNGLEALGPDVCTRPACFATKQRIHFVRFVEIAEAAGTHQVVKGQDAKDMMRSNIDRPTGMHATCQVWVDGKLSWRSYEDLITDMRSRNLSVPVPLLMVAEEDEKPHEMLKPTDAKKVQAFARATYPDPSQSPPSTAAQAPDGAHVTWPFPTPGAVDQDDEEEDEPPTPEARAVTGAMWSAVREAIMRAAARHDRTTVELRLVLLLIMDLMDEVPESVAKVMGWREEWLDVEFDDNHRWFASKIKDLTADQLGTLLVCMVISEFPVHAHSGKAQTEARLKLAATYGVDVLALQASEPDEAGSAGKPAAFGGDLVDAMEASDA